MNPYVSLIIDVIILGVLAATIFYARRLSRQIAAMRADRKTFEKLIEAINHAATRADAATRALREAAQQGGDRLQDKINTARALSDELEIVVQAGDSLAERLENLARRNPAPPEENCSSSRADAPQMEKRLIQKNLPEKPEAGQQPRTRAEKELLEALRSKQRSS